MKTNICNSKRNGAASKGLYREGSTRSLLAAFLLCGFIATATAADVDGGPEYVGVIAAFDPLSRQYISLERVRPTRDEQARLLGYLGGQVRYIFPGEKSPVRFKAGQPIEFVIRVERQDKDPVALIQFYRLEVTEGKRALPLADQAHAFTTMTDLRQQSVVSFRAKKLGTSFFEFTASQALMPGEYALSAVDIPDTFNFGIDTNDK